MGSSKDLFSKATIPNFILDDEAIAAFIDEVRQRESKEEYIDIGYYELPTEIFWEFEGDGAVQEGFLKMAKAKVIAIFNLLKTADIEKHIYSICSIIQSHCCRMILVEIVQPSVYQNASFPKEFYSLYKVLTNDILEIKVSTNRKNETCIIKSPYLIKLLLTSFKESVLNLSDAVDYIYEIETDELYVDLPESKLLDSAIINLLIYIQTNTDYKFNKNMKEVQSLSFSNKQFELIYELLVLGGIINDTDIGSPAKDYIRVKVQRALTKKPSLLNCFIVKKAEETKKEPILIYEADNEMMNDAFDNQAIHKETIANNIKNLLSH